MYSTRVFLESLFGIGPSPAYTVAPSPVGVITCTAVNWEHHCVRARVTAKCFSRQCGDIAFMRIVARRWQERFLGQRNTPRTCHPYPFCCFCCVQVQWGRYYDPGVLGGHGMLFENIPMTSTCMENVRIVLSVICPWKCPNNFWSCPFSFPPSRYFDQPWQLVYKQVLVCEGHATRGRKKE